MGKIDNQIRTNFSTYEELRKKRKTIENSPIEVSTPKQRHRSFQVGHCAVKHPTITKNIKFEVEVKVSNSKEFKFKLFCSDIFEKPFFRFDSAGATHKNSDPSIPLKEQLVTTPHFHIYNAKGIEIAYKTSALSSKKQQAALEDINICVMHFCQEGNMRFKKKEFPEINLQKGELGFKFTDDDPLKNVTF